MLSPITILETYGKNLDALLIKEVERFFTDNAHISNGILNCLLGFTLKATQGYLPNRKYLDRALEDWRTNLHIKTPMDAYLYTVRHKNYYSADKIKNERRVNEITKDMKCNPMDDRTEEALDNVFRRLK